MTVTLAVQCDVCGLTVSTDEPRDDWSKTVETEEFDGTDLSFELHACPDCDPAEIDGVYSDDDDAEGGG